MTAGERRHILSNWIQNKNRTEGSLSKVGPLPRRGRAEFGEGLGPKTTLKMQIVLVSSNLLRSREGIGKRETISKGTDAMLTRQAAGPT